MTRHETAGNASGNGAVSWERVAWGLMLIGGAVALAVLTWSMIAVMPLNDWNSARLYPAFVLAAGQPIYFPADTGPAIGWIYGPVQPILMWPATLAPTLTSGLMIGGALNALSLLVPMGWLAWIAARHSGFSRVAATTGAVLAALGCVVIPTLRGWLQWLHVDSPAVGLGLASCGFLACALEKDRGVYWWLAALAAVTAAGTKQMEVMLPLAQMLFLGIFYPARLGRYLGILVLVGVVCALIAVPLFGARALWQNLWYVSSHHAWKKGWPGYGRDLGLLFALGAVPLGLFALALWRMRRGPSAQNYRDPRARLGWLLVIAGLALSPLSAMAATKLGGGHNSFHSLGYFYAAGWIGFFMMMPRFYPRRPWLPVSVVGVCGMAAIGLSLRVIPVRWEPMPQLEAARVIAERFRGRILFPQNPLVTWWTEGKCYHFDNAMMNEALAGVPVSSKRFFEFLPAQLEWIAARRAEKDQAFVQLMPEFVLVAENENFRLYRRVRP